MLILLLFQSWKLFKDNMTVIFNVIVCVIVAVVLISYGLIIITLSQTKWFNRSTKLHLSIFTVCDGMISVLLGLKQAEGGAGTGADATKLAGGDVILRRDEVAAGKVSTSSTRRRRFELVWIQWTCYDITIMQDMAWIISMVDNGYEWYLYVYDIWLPDDDISERSSIKVSLFQDKQLSNNMQRYYIRGNDFCPF